MTWYMLPLEIKSETITFVFELKLRKHILGPDHMIHDV